MKTNMRLALAVAVSTAALYFDVPTSRAFENAPWCAVTNKGNGNGYWDCHYRSFEECVPNVLSGNRGFCNPNPSWNALTSVVPSRHRKRYHG